MKKIFTLIAAAFATTVMNAETIATLEVNEDGKTATVTVDGSESTADPAYGSNTVSAEDIEKYITLEGIDEIQISNGHKQAKAVIGSGGINLGGSGGSYVEIVMPRSNKLATGDKVVITTAAEGATFMAGIEEGSGKTIVKSGVANGVTYTLTLTSDFDGERYLYIYRGTSKVITKIEIQRNSNQVVAPVVSTVDGTIAFEAVTEGSTIKYGTSADAITNDYTGPITITEDATYYAQAFKDGMDASDVTSQAVVYRAFPATASLAATLEAPSTIAAGEADQELENLTNGTFTVAKTEGATLSNSAAWNNNTAFSGLVKVNKNLVVSTTGDDVIAGIKVIGITNADGATISVTATGMSYTTGKNVLPARDVVSTPGTAELVADTPAKEFTVTFSGQGRVKFEVYTTEASADAIATVEATSEAAVAVKKVVKNGQLVIVKNGAEFNAAGAQVK